jgi:hypothetical protein
MSADAWTTYDTIACQMPPIAQTHPNCLAGPATLFGMTPASSPPIR